MIRFLQTKNATVARRVNHSNPPLSNQLTAAFTLAVSSLLSTTAPVVVVAQA